MSHFTKGDSKFPDIDSTKTKTLDSIITPQDYQSHGTVKLPEVNHKPKNNPNLSKKVTCLATDVGKPLYIATM